MIKAEYRRKINKSSLIIIPDKDYEMERDSIEMFRYNEIPYFLKMEIQRKETELQFCYDITSKRSLEHLLEYKSLDYGMIQTILNSFDQACAQIEDFMMTENDLLLEPEFIFADHNVQHMSYCYLPGNQKDICKQFKGFMEYILQHLDHKDEQALQLAYGVYQRVVEERTALHNVLKEEQSYNVQCKNIFSRSSVSQIVEGESRKLANQVMENHSQELANEHMEEQIQILDHQVGENRMQSISVPDMENKTQLYSSQVMKDRSLLQVDKVKNETQILQSPLAENESKEGTQSTDPISNIKRKESLRKQAAEKLKKMLQKKIYTDKARYQEEDTVFEADEEEVLTNNPTVCLMPETDWIQNQFVYQGADRSRDFRCMQGKMLLGSDMEESDIYIPFPMVSRIHARVEIDAKGTFLEDMNSTNGTHVNGELLQYHERRMLQKGDIISLAGECYSFH